MASPSVAASLLLVCIGALSPLVQLASSESASVCPREPSPFLISLQSQCSASISPSLPLQNPGETGTDYSNTAQAMDGEETGENC